MATLLNKMVSWAAREAEELASKSGISLERAAEEVADKYGQKAFSATAKPAVEEFATTAPSMFLGDANAPRNRSLREMVSPGVEESITAREASRYTEPGPLNRPVSGAGERAMLGVQESTIARDASRYSEPVPPKQPSKSDTSASEDFEASFGKLDTGIYPSEISKTARRGLAGALGGAGIVAAGTAGYDKPKEVSDTRGVGPVADGEEYAKALASLPTPEVKKEVKKVIATTDTRAKEAQKAADKGEIPQAKADRFKEERDRAYQMYNEAKSRNEWLELAQILGQAVTQFGAAQVGMRTGRPMAGLQIPGVDYGARTAQEQRLLETRLRDIGAEQEREETLAERLRREKREAAADARAERELRLKEQEARRIPVDTTEQRELRREERKEQKATQAAITNIRAALATLAVGNKKQKEKALESIDKNLGEANLPAETVNKIQELKEEPGWFGGGAWETKRKEVESLLQPSAPSATMPPGGKVRVRKGSEVLEIDASDLAAARADGYELER